VTRQKENAVYKSIAEFDLEYGTPDTVLKDAVITVQKKGVDIELRRIAYRDEKSRKVYEFISNNFLLSPEKICDIYKHRWQIETMFKRLKQNFPLKYFLGDSPNAIKIQIWCDMVRIDHTTTDAGRAKKDQEDLGLFQYDLDGTPAPDELYRPV